ncbi:hypothetical protein BKA70DRAFT_459985 [Coprinopsis sp. MPI-PUGE-AT-0042]|nr:hypothetical protein BKA70DRAFT_459985 [Coprinopsis sp. MPI-PUGE-AT-0042]
MPLVPPSQSSNDTPPRHPHLLSNTTQGNVTITGGTFNDIGGDFIVYGNVYYVGTAGFCNSLDASYTPNCNNPTAPPAVRPRSPTDQSLRHTSSRGLWFVAVESVLQHVQRLVTETHTGDQLHKDLHIHIHQLQATLAISAKIYKACKGSRVGNLVRKAIDSRVLLCHGVLQRVHEELRALQGRSIPLGRLGLIGQVLRGCWSTTEAEVLGTIQSQLSEEIRAQAELLNYLKALQWTQNQVLASGSHFSWMELETFIQSPEAPMFRGINAAQIVVIDPFGDYLKIPLALVCTLEDVHAFVVLGCQGSKGTRFIEERQYQLDDSATNITIHKRNLAKYLQDGKVFEVTISLSDVTVAPGICPRCEQLYDPGQGVQEGGWLKCPACRVSFSTLMPDPSQEYHDSEDVV